MKITMQL